MDEFAEELDEAEWVPAPIGEYLGERNELGERHGKGWAILPNGDQYDGQYRKGFRHGRGLYVFVDGSRYLGNYRCGVRSGQGKFIYPDGTVYEGSWKNNKKHGQGTYTYVNGDTYRGAWFMGKRHGVGTYTWKGKGVSFEGTWNDGVRVGPCIVHYNNFKFHGSWDFKYPQGPGVFSFKARHLLNGYFRSDTLFTGDQLKACEEGYEFDGKEKEEEEEKLLEGEEEAVLEMEVLPSKWVSQNMVTYENALLPQHPVPLPIVDSEPSLCDLDSVEPERSITPESYISVKTPSIVFNLEEEGSFEQSVLENESESEKDCDFFYDEKKIE